MNTIEILLLILIFILLIWNSFELYFNKKVTQKTGQKYFELSAKINFLTATGTLAILLISYLGLNVKDEILKKSETPIRELITKKSKEIDSSLRIIDTLLASKNVLKAGIYIVNDLTFKVDKIIKFQNLLTIDKKSLPSFSYAPKLMIITNTGENIRIKKVTNEYFILGEPISKNYSILAEQGDPDYPKILKFDLWIADYKQN